MPVYVRGIAQFHINSLLSLNSSGTEGGNVPHLKYNPNQLSQTTCKCHGTCWNLYIWAPINQTCVLVKTVPWFKYLLPSAPHISLHATGYVQNSLIIMQPHR